MATGVSVSIALEGDSAVIFYDDSRIQYYSISDTSDRSLLNDEAYIIESEKEKKRTHIGVRRYLFTERDYESATEVGG